MPTYDYRCKACHHAFELVQSMRAPVKRKCPECGKLQLERLVGVGAGFIIKGRASAPEPPPAAAPSDDASSDTSADGKKKQLEPGAAKAGGSAGGDTSTPSSGETNGKEGTATERERRISGSTSTPTHAAREGRGVGNLVDKARRRAKDRGPATRQPRKRKQK